ncbi:hypothetical protein TSEDIMI_30109 [Tenacibaculum sediminilitoris]|uniref:hypothetical protein n=1 Tax=Tenacibaculum sediminilitoris TaxID=1820334 RepID=UPI003893A1EE
MKHKKNYFGIISAIGLLCIMIGYAYMMYKLNTITEEVELKQQNLKEITRELTITEKKLVLKKELINELDSQIKKSNDTTLILRTSNQIITNNNLEKSIEANKQNTTIYIQVNTKKVQATLEKVDLVGFLNAKGYTTYGYDFVSGRANNTLRYFHEEDVKIAKSVQKILKTDFNITLKLVFIKKYGDKAPKKQLELWIK